MENKCSWRTVVIQNPYNPDMPRIIQERIPTEPSNSLRPSSLDELENLYNAVTGRINWKYTPYTHKEENVMTVATDSTSSESQHADWNTVARANRRLFSQTDSVPHRFGQKGHSPEASNAHSDQRFAKSVPLKKKHKCKLIPNSNLSGILHGWNSIHPSSKPSFQASSLTFTASWAKEEWFVEPSDNPMKIILRKLQKPRSSDHETIKETSAYPVPQPLSVVRNLKKPSSSVQVWQPSKEAKLYSPIAQKARKNNWFTPNPCDSKWVKNTKRQLKKIKPGHTTYMDIHERQFVVQDKQKRRRK